MSRSYTDHISATGSVQTDSTLWASSVKIWTYNQERNTNLLAQTHAQHGIIS